VNDEPVLFVYILECSDGTLYTGWTNKHGKTAEEHNEGTNGASTTRGRRPSGWSTGSHALRNPMP